MGLSKAEAFFKNEEELEIIYPAEVKSVKDKKRLKEMILKENSEMLLSDYSGPDNNRVRCNLLFFTEHPSSWHTILCSPGAEEGERGTGQKRTTRLHTGETAGGDKNTTTHNTTAAVCQHTTPQHPHKHNSTPETCRHTNTQHLHKLNSTVSELLHSCNRSVSSSPSEPQEERQQQHSD